MAKINTSFSSWTELTLGVPQGSVLGPLLFNLYLNDLFYLQDSTSACNLADDTTLYAADIDLNTLLKRIEHDTMMALEWFEYNHMKLNEEKCHLLVGGNKHECTWVKVGNTKIYESHNERLLGVQIDRELAFKHHVLNLCKKASQKLSALVRLCHYYTLHQRRITMQAFIKSQFSFSPLAWMFHDREINTMINKIHARALRIVYRDDISTFNQLLEKDGSFCVHHKNIHSMAIEMYKAKQNIGPSILNDIFLKKSSFNIKKLRSQNDFLIPRADTVHCGHDSLKYFGPIIWDLIPVEIRNSPDIDTFKLNIKKWTPSECPCRLCRNYIGGVGYI